MNNTSHTLSIMPYDRAYCSVSNVASRVWNQAINGTWAPVEERVQHVCDQVRVQLEEDSESVWIWKKIALA